VRFFEIGHQPRAEGRAAAQAHSHLNPTRHPMDVTLEYTGIINLDPPTQLEEVTPAVARFDVKPALA
jgi:hypothetical protein